jgi:hypothetical protein
MIDDLGESIERGIENMSCYIWEKCNKNLSHKISYTLRLKLNNPNGFLKNNLINNITLCLSEDLYNYYDR